MEVVAVVPAVAGPTTPLVTLLLVALFILGIGMAVLGLLMARRLR